MARRESFWLKYNACFAGSYPFRLLTAFAATFPKGTAFGGGGKVSGIAQRRPLGGAGAQRLKGLAGLTARLHSSRRYFKSPDLPLGLGLHHAACNVQVVQILALDDHFMIGGVEGL